MLKEFEPSIESITLVPSDGGRYEFSVNGTLIYSKLVTHRHADPGEVASLLRDYIKQG